VGNFTAFQHSIRPEVTYEYIPDNVKGFTPFFDRLDGNLRRNSVQFGFTNFLTGKEVRRDEEGNPVTSYRELARMQLFQLYNFEKPSEILPDPRFGPSPTFIADAVKGYADLGFRVDLTPKRFITLSYSADYSPERREATQQDVFMTLDSGRGHTIRFDYQFRNDVAVDEFITETNIKITSGLYVGTYHDYSLQRETLFRQGYAVRYVAGCWAMGLSFEREGNDDRVAFSVDLLGLGSYGGGRAHRLGEKGNIPFDSEP
jgi:LPS-assembly protein